jgi:hypothetical protein
MLNTSFGPWKERMTEGQKILCWGLYDLYSSPNMRQKLQVARVQEMKFIEHFYRETLGIIGRIILKWILEKHLNMWTGINWLRMGSSGRLL